jgi:hypothetical protein
MRWPVILVAAVALAVLLLGPGTGDAAPAAAPNNTSSPTISGVAQQGKTLTASSGSWVGTTPITFAYQWRRCDSAGANCSNIAGATGQTYQVAAADVGRTLRIRVTASNSDGSAEETSDPTAVVAAANAPTNTSPPTIAGTARENETLTAHEGTWSGTAPIAYAYEWRRCNAAGADCSDIGSATSKTYVLQSSDVDRTLRVSVTASNSAGSNQVVSGQTGVVAASGTAPAVTKPPEIDGKPVVGETLKLDNGKWSGTDPISYSYQWQRCATSGNCSAIARATGDKYTPVLNDAGRTLRGAVTASNPAGSSTAVSMPTAVVQGPPVPVALPRILGTPRQGQTLIAEGGKWQTPKQLRAVFVFWARCDVTGTRCVRLRAFGRTYVPTTADVGHRMMITVKAENAIGAGFANSPPSAVVAKAQLPVPNPVPPKPSIPGTIPVASVALPNRLVIDRVQFLPSRIRSRSEPLVARFRVVDSSGKRVMGALVYGAAVPFDRLSAEPEAQTDVAGWATIRYAVLASFPLREGYLVTIFVRARKPGGSILGGVSTRRLVSVRVA